MKILVVEGDEALASLLLRALAQDGHVVDRVDGDAMAIAQSRHVRYDLVILDVQVPSIDGRTTCSALRAAGGALAILMLSARAEAHERVAGLDAGADDFLPTPFDVEELLARVRALGRRNRTGRHVEVGPARLDLREQIVTLAGERLDLTRREFVVLSCLLRDAGRIVSPIELLRKVSGSEPGYNLVEVLIKNLRHKLGEHATRIETVRGVGYRWRGESGAPVTPPGSSEPPESGHSP